MGFKLQPVNTIVISINAWNIPQGPVSSFLKVLGAKVFEDEKNLCILRLKPLIMTIQAPVEHTFQQFYTNLELDKAVNQLHYS